MGILVAWDNDNKSVLRITYEESWNWKDHRITQDVINTLLSTVDHPVDLVIEIHESEPARITSCAVNEVTQCVHKNWSGKVVVVSPNSQLAERVLAATPALVAR